jgi:hypothetical protein
LIVGGDEIERKAVEGTQLNDFRGLNWCIQYFSLSLDLSL